ncbi:helix-turn-helix domain-containing protein [Candidatus Poseidonia alphae]|nr:helix-turn-helix domain-containing protein [Candidatus Poseidonia alphae]
MAPKEDDLTRLKILLASGLSITEAAKRMDVSRSTAQRLKKKIVEISDSDGDTEFVFGVLSDNAVTLRVASGKMHEMLDWSKPIYWNNLSIFQKHEDYWLTYPLGKRLQEWHDVKRHYVKGISTEFLSEVLMLSGLGTQNHYKSVTTNLSPWMGQNWYRYLENWLERSYYHVSELGDLSTRHLQSYKGPKLELIIDSIMRRCEGFEDEAPFIHFALFARLGDEQDKALEILQAKGIEIGSYSEQWISIATFGRDMVSPDEFLETRTQDENDEHDYPTGVLFFGIKNILQAYTELPEEVIDYMIQHNNYESTDVELVIFGGIDEVDLEFAKKGQFRNIGQLNLAREKSCTNIAELELVVDHGWACGDELRKAQDHYGVGADGRQLYLNMAELNPQVNWTGEWKHDLLDWADLADDEDFQRLRGFPDPKSMVFFEDVLMQIDEDSVRTDFLIRDFNEIDAPGSFISDEAEFGELLAMPCFRDIVKVGKLGVSTINLASRSKEEWKPKAKISGADYPNFSRSRKKAVKELKTSLEENALNASLTGAYDWMASNLRSKLSVGKKEEIHVIDQIRDLLDFDQSTNNALHQARLARNWIGHPMSAKEVKPTWEMVELCLKTTEDILDLEI